MGRQFNEFKASELFCPRCQACQPVRERTEGQATQLLCSRCGTVVGRHTTVDHRLGPKLARLVSGFFTGKK
ncbi:MAG: hypothetical protein EB141_20610 [Verrucomicrobia bacterium]|nr:hypothetical protein [Verrucomicrobiota bacterium]NBU10929.1 hypothetical protein [Pseudomonadota bacterium]NDA66205.1 hypothetical protein [Verrucomicrobiota bacterium]NDB78013.1 hypothetical protein [Verrucomicrobiota bacterium]NDD39566.1 hypothetical protein [Verrucomicrobiota bacterium]